jgi:hypothetical protein
MAEQAQQQQQVSGCVIWRQQKANRSIGSVQPKLAHSLQDKLSRLRSRAGSRPATAADLEPGAGFKPHII